MGTGQQRGRSQARSNKDSLEERGERPIRGSAECQGRDRCLWNEQALFA